MLGALGLPVDRQGTLLVHAGRAVHVDAPCSGVWMLWVALVVVCALSFARRLGWTQTVALALVTLPVVFVGNTVRTLALFLVESGRVEAPSWLHESVGLLVFAAMVAALLWLLERIEGRTRWAFASR